MVVTDAFWWQTMQRRSHHRERLEHMNSRRTPKETFQRDFALTVACNMERMETAHRWSSKNIYLGVLSWNGRFVCTLRESCTL